MTKLVGILNITPDSFSDGGRFNQLDAARNHLAQMLHEGADVIDIGAESTRPGAQVIDADTEWRRLERILPQIIADVSDFNRKNHKNILTSIDTRYVATAGHAWDCGINIINDVSGLQDDEMIALIAETGMKTVFMHSLSIPANPEIIVNRALNVTAEIMVFARAKIDYLTKCGVKKSQLIFDPGVGFSKNAEQSLRIVKNIAAFKELGLPLYVGHSKKSFLDALHIEGMDRAQKTLIISHYLAVAGVDFIRVHDVAANKRAIQEKRELLKF